MDTQPPVDPTKPPPGTKQPWYKIPFDTKLMLPIMTGGIIIVLILQAIIWFSTKGQPIAPATDSLRPTPTAAVAPTVQPGSARPAGASQDTYINGVMRFTFGPEWRLQTGNAPPNLGFATFTFERCELGTVNVRVYNTLPSSFIPPKREEFYDPKSSYWIVGRAQNSQSTTTFQAPVPVTIAGKKSMMQEYETSQQFERAYYVPVDETNAKYLLIITGVNKITPHKDDLFLEVSKLLSAARPDTAPHSFTDAEGKYTVKLSYAYPMQYSDRTLKFPLSGVTMNYERTNARSAADYLTLKNGCNKPEDGRNFPLDDANGMIFEKSKCSELGASELFVVQNGIGYSFSINDLPQAKRAVLGGFTFTD